MAEVRAPLRVVRSGPSRVALIGELDIAGLPDVEEHLTDCPGEILLDCSRLTFVDASGLSLFIRIHNACKTRGVKFALVEPSPCVRRLLTITGLDQLLLSDVGGLRQ